MITTARANDITVAPRKVGEVVALVRGRTVEDALTILEHTPRKAALPVSKLINSARANAENNHDMDVATLTIKEITVGPGTRYKRYRPASRGRALPYVRQRSNILIRVEGVERKSKSTASAKVAEKSPKKKTAAKTNKKEDK